MVAINAQFDGKVIVPDEPLDLAPYQRLIVHVQQVVGRPTDFRAWLGLATRAPQNPTPKFRADRELWE